MYFIAQEMKKDCILLSVSAGYNLFYDFFVATAISPVQ